MATAAETVKVGHQSARERLTDKRVEKLAAPAGKRIEIGDTIVRELRMRVSDKGAKSWSLLYRVAGAGDGETRGAMKRMTLGAYPLVGLEKAREKARDALGAADRGIDPASQRDDELVQRKVRTFAAVFERFVDLHVKQNTKEGRFAKERAAALVAAQEGKAKPKGPTSKLGRVAAERIIADHALPLWRDRLVETITRAEVHDLLDDVVTDKGEALARELRKHLSALFNWAADRGHIATSPLAGMRRPGMRYKPRERVLSMEELRRIWDAAGSGDAGLGYPFGPMYRLLILTGQRRSEVAELERGWLDAQHRAIEIPASRYKTKRPHVFPLSPSAWALVDALPHWNGGDCMFTTTSGVRPVSGFSKAKARLNELVTEAGAKTGLPPLAEWTVHDIRRSVATHMARLGVQQEHIERVLGHVVQGVAGTYNRYSYLDEKRAALELWGKSWS